MRIKNPIQPESFGQLRDLLGKLEGGGYPLLSSKEARLLERIAFFVGKDWPISDFELSYIQSHLSSSGYDLFEHLYLEVPEVAFEKIVSLLKEERPGMAAFIYHQLQDRHSKEMSSFMGDIEKNYAPLSALYQELPDSFTELFDVQKRYLEGDYEDYENLDLRSSGDNFAGIFFDALAEYDMVDADGVDLTLSEFNPDRGVYWEANGAIFRNVDFGDFEHLEGDFREADFREADLSGVVFGEAYLDGADFRGAKMPEAVHSKEADPSTRPSYNMETQFPEGFNPREHGWLFTAL